MRIYGQKKNLLGTQGSENAEEFKKDTNLYTAYLTGVQDTAKYLSQH